jgi:hypothetical protein
LLSLCLRVSVVQCLVWGESCWFSCHLEEPHGETYDKCPPVQRPWDGINGERFQSQAALLAICKVDRSLLDVQWNGWLFDDRLSMT